MARCCSDRQIMKGIGHWWWLKPAAVEWNTLINIHNITWLESVTRRGGGKWRKEQLLIKHQNTISLWTAVESLLQIIISLIIGIWTSITAALWGPTLWLPEEENVMHVVIFIPEGTRTVHPMPAWSLEWLKCLNKWKYGAVKLKVRIQCERRGDKDHRRYKHHWLQ